MATSTYNHLNELSVNTALAQINESMNSVNNLIGQVDDARETLETAWKSENATKVKNYVSNIHDNLASLYSSINNISAKVSQVVEATVKTDDVNINSGGNSLNNSSSSNFNAINMQ